MGRIFVIFYLENHENGNAVWRCLPDKNGRFLSGNSMKTLSCQFFQGLSRLETAPELFQSQVKLLGMEGNRGLSRVRMSPKKIRVPSSRSSHLFRLSSLRRVPVTVT